MKALILFGMLMGATLLAEEAKELPIVPPKGHPRLLILPSDLGEMKRRYADPHFENFKHRVLALTECGWMGELPVPSGFDPKEQNWMELGRGNTTPTKEQNYDPRLHDLIEFCAVRYLLEGNEAMGQRAIHLLSTVLTTVTFPDIKEAGDITRGKGALITTAGIVYDWCYPLLNTDQKKLIIEQMKRIAKMTEVGYPPVKQSSVTGHAGEANVFRDMIAGGIAIYDEDPEMYRFAGQRLFDYLIPARQYFYPSHWHNQGSGYGHVRLKWELWSACIFNRMSGKKVFGEDQGQLLYGAYYSTRPDGVQMSDGDASLVPVDPKPHQSNESQLICELLTTYLTKDPIVAGQFQKHLQTKPGFTETLAYFLFDQPQIQPQPLSALPLTRYFKDPAGILMARTGWEEGKDSPTVVAMMKIAPVMFSNHQHLDAGHFQLYYKGILAGDSGMYQGKEGGYGAPHWLNYFQRSIAHNTLTVFDPNEKWAWGTKATVDNDGGQHWPLDGKEAVTIDDIVNKGYRAGQVLAEAFGPDASTPVYSHLCGKIESYGPKVENFVRSFVFLRLEDKAHPAVLAVYDRVRSANPEFQKKWLLHTVENPVELAEGFAVNSPGGGKMHGTVLYPRSGNRNMECIGGPGKEFLVNGIPYPITPKKGVLADYEGTGWRLELSPVQPNKEDRFLVVMQVFDQNSNTNPLPVASLEEKELAGFAISNQAVYFPKGDGLLKQSLSITLPSGGVYDVIITGVSKGIWKSAKNPSARFQVTAAGNLLRIPAASDTLELIQEQ
jgi:Heparinase II/III-like protein